MFKNVHYDTRESKIYLWEQINGENLFDIQDYVPFVFVEDPDDENNLYRTLDEKRVAKKNFKSYGEYNSFQKDVFCYENKTVPTQQFLSKRYFGIPDDDIQIPKLNIYSIDIEVHSEKRFDLTQKLLFHDNNHYSLEQARKVFFDTSEEVEYFDGVLSKWMPYNEEAFMIKGGFPHPKDAQHPITVINVRRFGKDNISWGIKGYTGKNEYNCQYIECKTEDQVILKFLEWWNKNSPDVVTGWNIAADSKMNDFGGFDFPYIINRIKRLWGDDTKLYNKLSPIGKVRTWNDKKTDAMYVSLAGVSIIDYMSLYKWYTPKNQENYRLDTISRDELDLGKIDYSEEYGDLKTLYKENYNLYVDYNVVDNQRIEELEDKLGYIKIAQVLTLLCKVEMKNYTSSTNLIEGLMLTHYRRNGMAAPFYAENSKEWFPAAIVKEPRRGLHKDILAIDVSSSYPTAIVLHNMSTETFYGRITKYTQLDGQEGITASIPDEILVELVKREIKMVELVRRRELLPFTLKTQKGITNVKGEHLNKFNKALKMGLFSIAPCGSIFKTKKLKVGEIAKVVKQNYFKRQEIKALAKQNKALAATKEGEEKQQLLELSENQTAIQTSLKLILNSVYGVFSFPYTRYCNYNIGMAITACGRASVWQGQNYVNEILNSPDPEICDLICEIKEITNK